MKRNLRVVLIAVFMISAPFILQAQTPPHPNGGSGPGTGNHAVGSNNGAPVENGSFILLTLALAYAARKLYDLRNKKTEETA